VTRSTAAVSECVQWPFSVRPHRSVRIPLEQVEAFAVTNGVVAHLEATAADETDGTTEEEAAAGSAEEQEIEEDGDEIEDEEDSEDVRTLWCFPAYYSCAQQVGGASGCRDYYGAPNSFVGLQVC
jgi:hypothetical protein